MENLPSLPSVVSVATLLYMDRKKKQITPNHLRNFRHQAGLNQSDVAFLLDIKNVGRISEWENGLSNPSIEHLFTLSLIYTRLEAQLYHGLRKKLRQKYEIRKKLLREMKERKNKLESG